MDLIYTTAKRVDEGVLKAHAFDLSFGAEENDFELTLGANEPLLEYGAFIYIEGTEYGGIVSGKKSYTAEETMTYMGSTWHGILNNKVIEPDSGEDYYIVSGDANVILAQLVARLGLGSLFVANEEESGINISRYQFHRYCKGYDGILAMLESKGAKLKIEWKGRNVLLSAVPVVDYTEAPIDGDEADLSVERHEKKVNHLICLGRGNLADRQVIHLYVDKFGRISEVQYYTGLDEIAEIYDNSSAESLGDLRNGGIQQLKQLRNNDTAEIKIAETESVIYDIGDIVGASDVHSDVSVSAAVSQKIVKINNGIVKLEYKTGGTAASSSDTTAETESSSGDSESGEGTTEITSLPVASDITLGGIKVGYNLEITEDGVLSVTTADEVEKDNTKPITSSAVAVEVGNINTLLATI